MEKVNTTSNRRHYRPPATPRIFPAGYPYIPLVNVYCEWSSLFKQVHRLLLTLPHRQTCTLFSLPLYSTWLPVGYSYYANGKKFYRRCEIYLHRERMFCLCCWMALRNSSTSKSNKERARLARNSRRNEYVEELQELL
jgi:hypothetical protein